MITFAELKTITQLAVKPIRGDTHHQRLESFYGGQASEYDQFRRKLLHGREQMLERVAEHLPEPRHTWLDIGGGTCATLEMNLKLTRSFQNIVVVDLSPSLLEIGRQRLARLNLDNVKLSCQDAENIALAQEQKIQLATFSYSLTMIPNWFSALESALRLMAPGGLLGIVDFYISRKFPPQGLVKHSWGTRTLWPIWFGHDNVNLSPDLLPFLLSHFDTIHLAECFGKVPFMLGLKAPYLVYVGRVKTK